MGETKNYFLVFEVFASCPAGSSFSSAGPNEVATMMMRLCLTPSLSDHSSGLKNPRQVTIWPFFKRSKEALSFLRQVSTAIKADTLVVSSPVFSVRLTAKENLATLAVVN